MDAYEQMEIDVRLEKRRMEAEENPAEDENDAQEAQESAESYDPDENPEES